VYLPLTHPFSSFDAAILVFAVSNSAIFVPSLVHRLCVYHNWVLLRALLLGCHNSAIGLKWSEYVPEAMHWRQNRCPHLHNFLNIQPIPVPIHRITDKFFAHCPLHPSPQVQQIGKLYSIRPD